VDRPARLKLLIRVHGVEVDRPWASDFEIAIDPAGRPVSVKFGPLENPDLVPPPTMTASAIAQIHTWRFVPFQVNGRPTYARFVAYFTLVPDQDRPSVHVLFPEVTDLGKVVMTYREGGGMNRGPRYVAVHGDGQVDVDGFDGYSHRRPSPITIPKEKVLSLIDAFRRADFFSFKDSNSGDLSDVNSKTTAITIDGRTSTDEHRRTNKNDRGPCGGIWRPARRRRGNRGSYRARRRLRALGRERRTKRMR
jgi:hypothetical protein